jgi:hypothetical protein
VNSPSGHAPPLTISVSPNTGSAQAFTGVYSEPNGAAELSEVTLLSNSTNNLSNACYVRYTVSTGQIELLNDAATGWSAGLTPGGTGTVSNSQCTLNASGSSVSSAGDDLTVAFNLAFNTSAFSGNKNLYLAAVNAFNQGSGRNLLGSWVIP